MEDSKISIFLWTLFLINTGLHCQGQDHNPALEDAASISKPEFGRLEHPRANTLDLESYVQSLSGTIDELSSMVRDIREHVTDIQEQVNSTVWTLGRSPHSSKNENTERLLRGAERRAKIGMILRDPKATLFTGENMTGEAFDYDSTQSKYPGGCQTLPSVKSIRISDSCVRLFRSHNCEFLSLAIYPKSDSGSFINVLTFDGWETAGSIGPCLPNEFEFATLSVPADGPHRIAIIKDESKVRQVADLMDIDGYDTYLVRSKSVGLSTNPIENYYLDQGRPKYIQARIYNWHLNSALESEENLSEEGMAQRNMGIPAGLGGPTNAVYNSFPQTPANLEQWKQITDQIKPHLKANNPWVYVCLTLVYDNSLVMKPYGFYYFVYFQNNASSAKILYGFIQN